MSTQKEYPVFADDKGNRFIFPGIYKDDEKSVYFWQCMELRLAIGLTQEAEPAVVSDEIPLPNVRTEILHRGFAHGAATVCLIGGPLFDEISAATEEA